MFKFWSFFTEWYAFKHSSRINIHGNLKVYRVLDLFFLKWNIIIKTQVDYFSIGRTAESSGGSRTIINRGHFNNLTLLNIKNFITKSILQIYSTRIKIILRIVRCRYKFSFRLEIFFHWNFVSEKKISKIL